MSKTRIYIICTYNSRGRYVQTATPNRNRAALLVARLVEDYTADGWNNTETQTIPADEWKQAGPGVPAVVEVAHLRNAAGDWCNVELYRVEDINEN